MKVELLRLVVASLATFAVVSCSIDDLPKTGSPAGKSGTGGAGGTTGGTVGGSVTTGGNGGSGLGTAGGGGDAGSGTAGAGTTAGSGADGSAGAPSSSVCGNRVVENGEVCDDGNRSVGDGCSPTCEVEDGWTCDAAGPGGTAGMSGEGGATGESTGCKELCGDGLIVGREALPGGCDDHNEATDDGCASCRVVDGWFCSGLPSECTETCGNGNMDGAEECDDSNSDAGDGCFACRETSRSCRGMTGSECQGGSCCESPFVTGGTFEQGGEGGFAGAGATGFPSTVSDFRLDKYEATVGRFREFVNVYDAWLEAGNPARGAGANPHIDGTGWGESAWTPSGGGAGGAGSAGAGSGGMAGAAADSGPLPADAEALKTNLKCNQYATWADAGQDTLPINCVSWYEAFAFCIWDGGRLPTESEWEYAAAGGSNDYLYPWGNMPVPNGELDDTAAYALYAGLGDGIPRDYTIADVLPVGSKPRGAGVYGQRDLAGSMFEWALDWKGPYPGIPKTDYARLAAGSYHSWLGGSWSEDASFLLATSRNAYGAPTDRQENVGVRCARRAP